MGELLRIEDLSVAYGNRKYHRNNYNREIIRNLSFSICEGEIFGLIGESGCGKTTTAKAICDLVNYKGNIFWKKRNLHEISKKERCKEIQLIFQNPYNSLDPSMKIKYILEEPLRIQRLCAKQERIKRVDKVLELIGFDSELKNRYIKEMSGGQRQRIAIGCGLMLNPQLIIADEVLSALDVSVQASVLNLFSDINRKLNISFLFISHDINAVVYLCDRIAVMYKGQIVEMGDAMEIYSNPLHPYTKLLLKTVVGIEKQIEFFDFSPNGLESYKPQYGCVYASECPVCRRECFEQNFKLRKVSKNHEVQCNLYV